MKTLLFDSTTVAENAPMPAVITAVESAFLAHANGTTVMPSKTYIDLPNTTGDFRSMPAYVDTGDWDAAGIKWVNSHPDNPTNHNLPTVMGIFIYSHPETAVPLAILDGTVLTSKRTGAAAAVATDHLAVETAHSLGIIGAGAQSYALLEAIKNVRPIDTVIVADRNEPRVRAFIRAYENSFTVRGGTIAEAAGCDILCTVTPVEDPIVPRDAVGDHTHVNAIGADAPGKHELADAVLRDAKLVIDDYDQCIHSGEINVPWQAGLLTEADVYGTLGELIAGNKRGRSPDDTITVFDSTGLAIQDVAAAHVVYEQATTTGTGYPFELIEPPTRD